MSLDNAHQGTFFIHNPCKKLDFVERKSVEFSVFLLHH